MTPSPLQAGDDRITGDTLVPGDGAQDRIERAESGRTVVRDGDPLVGRHRGFQDNMTADLMCPRILPFPAQGTQRGAHRRRRVESSCHQQDLVADEVEANSIGARPVKEER